MVDDLIEKIEALPDGEALWTDMGDALFCEGDDLKTAIKALTARLSEAEAKVKALEGMVEDAEYLQLDNHTIYKGMRWFVRDDKTADVVLDLKGYDTTSLPSTYQYGGRGMSNNIAEGIQLVVNLQQDYTALRQAISRLVERLEDDVNCQGCEVCQFEGDGSCEVEMIERKFFAPQLAEVKRLLGEGGR